MADISTVEVDYIRPLLPQCSSDHVSQDDFDTDRADSFALNSASYYKDVLQSTIPGLVLGGLSLICFFVFAVWSIAHFCCLRGRAKKKIADDQFMKALSRSSEIPYGDLESNNGRRRGCSTERFLQLVIFLLMLAMIGVSGWGIAASIQYTESQVTDFWNVVDRVQDSVNNVYNELRSVEQQLQTMEETLSAVNQEREGIQSLSDYLDVSSSDLNNALEDIDEVQNTLGSIRGSLSDGLQQVDETLVTALNDIERDYRSPTLSIENKWRFVVIGLLFGFSILISMMSGIFTIRLKHTGWAAFFVALLWFIVMLLMLLGTGLLQGVHVVSTDTCLYGENFAYHYAMDQINDEETRNFVTRVILYYTSPTRPEVEDRGLGSLISFIIGYDLATPLQDIFENSILIELSVLANNPTAIAVLNTALQPQTVASIQEAAALIEPVQESIANLDADISYDVVVPVYQAAKEYLCCGLSSSSNDLFVAWTVVGSLGFALATLCSSRIVHNSATSKRKPL